MRRSFSISLAVCAAVSSLSWQCAYAQAPSTLSSGPTEPAGAQYHVATSGSDNAAGTEDAPFASILRARDAIRTLRETADLPPGGVTVWIAAGDYTLTEPIALEEKDSGAEGKPITYRSKMGDNVRLLSNRHIEPAAWRPLNAAARDRVHPKTDPEKLRELDVSTLGLERTAEFAPNRSFSTNWYIIDLFADGRRQPLSQWPNPREMVAGEVDPGWITCNGTKDERAFFFGPGGHPQDGETQDRVNADGTKRAQRWQAALQAGHEVWLKGLWRTPWDPYTQQVEEINLAGNWIRFHEPPPGGVGSKYTQPYSAQEEFRRGNGKENWLALNLLEEIDEPGEWALDIKDQKVYYFPSAEISTLDIAIADRATPSVQLEGASFVNFLGLEINGGMGAGVEITGGSDLRVAGCTVRNVGGSGIYVQGASRVTLQSNDILETAGWGIELEKLGNRRKLLSAQVTVTNNHIHHIGRLAFKEAVIVKESVGVQVSHNLVHDIPKGATRTLQVNNCTFEYNEFHNISLSESDTGIFYNYGGWTTYGNVFRYNFGHHINRANGLYSDDGDSGDVYYGNIVHDAINGILFGGGHDNLAKGNLFVESKAQSVDSRGTSRNYRLGTPYEKRVFDMRTDREPWAEYGVNLQKEFGFTTQLWSDVLDPAWRPELPHGCVMTGNVAIASGKFTGPTEGRVEIADNLELPSVEEGQFFDYANMDLRTNNAAILAKIPDLNEFFLRIGLQTDGFRLTVPTRKETGGLANRGKEGDEWNEDQMR